MIKLVMVHEEISLVEIGAKALALHGSDAQCNSCAVSLHISHKNIPEGIFRHASRRNVVLRQWHG